MDRKLYNTLKDHKVFSSLDENTITQIQDKFTKIELKYDDILFEQGQESSNIYVLISGKLSASIVTTANQFKVIGYIEEGEIIGELAALADKPYPYTIKALRNCIVFQLSKKDFLEICYLYPSCLHESVQPLLSRSSNLTQLLTVEDSHNTVAIFPANNHVNMHKFIDKLTNLILSKPEFILFSDYLSENNEMTDNDIYEKIHQIEHHKKSTQQIIFILKSCQTSLANIAFKKTDIIYLVANALSEPLIDPIIVEYLYKNKLDIKPLPNLIMLHPETTQMPRHTSPWLQITPFNMHHHVKIDNTKHYERLLRFIRGDTTGLILGGGGTRGWGHMGAIKALCEQEHPVDFIGGTSVGAIIGGCYAMRESYEDSYTKFSKIVSTSKNSISWKSVTWPLISIFDSKTFTNANLEVFENTLIEDLWLPFFCVSSNLANYSEEIHRTGLLWEKIRASSSIPGLIPPMVINGEIHFDGGLLNNLPVDIMWQFLGKKAKVIGVELNSSMHDNHKYHFPPILAFKQAIAMKLGLYKEIFKIPRFVDIIFRGMLAGSSAKAKQNGLSATILVNLSLRKFGMLKYSNKQAQKMIDIGFLETTTQLHQYKNRNI